MSVKNIGYAEALSVLSNELKIINEELGCVTTSLANEILDLIYPIIEKAVRNDEREKMLNEVSRSMHRLLVLN